MSDPAAEKGLSQEPPEPRYLPVPAGEATVEGGVARPLARLAAVGVPVAAASGFVAGVITFVLARVLRRRSAQRAVGRALGRSRRRNGIDVAASRSFLVDIHLLRR